MLRCRCIPVCALLWMLLVALATAVHGQGTPRGISVHDTTLIPLRYIAEWLGATVDYTNGRITLQLNSQTIALTINSATATVGNSEYHLSVPAVEQHGITYVPLRFVAEGFQAKVDWDEARQQATITHPTSGETITIPVTPASAARSYSVLPAYTSELSGNNEVRIVNPNDTGVSVGLRSDGDGVDFTVAANDTHSVYVPDGAYKIYFVYTNHPKAVYQGDDFTLSGNGVEIQLVKIVNGNYHLRRVK